MPDFLILGAGFTASRVARRLVATGVNVIVTNRHPAGIAGARCLSFDATDAAALQSLRPHLSDGMAILHSIPILSGTPEIVEFLRPFHPSRMVYLSTTGVYGAAELVDEQTDPAPETDKDKDRIEAERVLSDGPWSTMILRPAAIYGPRRGIHWSARQSMTLPAPTGKIISRIHVDDLAEHALRAMQSTATGAFPVADQEPCTSLEVAEWTFAHLGLPFAPGHAQSPVHGRRVDGSAVRALLGIELLYPSFREGVAACLTEEILEQSL